MLSSNLIDAWDARLHRWSSAAAIVLTAHLTVGTLAMMQWPDDEFDPEPTGAVIMELAALAVAPPDPQDLAIGPQVEEATPTPQPTEKTVQEELELPPVEESPLAPEPELVLPKPQPAEPEKVVEEEPEQPIEQQVPEASAASSAATAPPKVEAAPAETVKAQAAGAKAKPNQAEVTWQKALLLHLNRHKRYPSQARNQRIQGVTKVEFKIDGAGKLVHGRIVKGSGSKLLDDEALAMLRRASPFPAPPSPPAGGTFHLALPVEFRIR